jgi:trans-2,3-dihydro-3-hydroxyanthranilate isomerase
LPRPIAFLDVFAERALEGNGLAVVDDAGGVSDEVMLAFARETRLSETTFVQPAATEGADYRNRIWTPGMEMPFAGHPSLGTAVAVARWQGLTETSFTQQTHAGLQPIDVKREEGEGPERWRASMLQAPLELGPELDREEAMRAVGLEPGDAHPELPPQVASTGARHLMAPLANEEALGRAAPDYAAIDALMSPHGAMVLYLAWWDPDSGRARARGFAADIGEDPATGSAVGPLLGYLNERAAEAAIEVSQGVEMGRPSVLHAEMEGELVRVSGSVVPTISGEVELPA